MLISLSQAIEPVGGYTTESVTHDQCDARPTVTFQANGQYQFILLGEQIPETWSNMELLANVTVSGINNCQSLPSVDIKDRTLLQTQSVQ